MFLLPDRGVARGTGLRGQGQQQVLEGVGLDVQVGDDAGRAGAGSVQKYASCVLPVPGTCFRT
ncbi:hypothetical protein OG333_00435 [Streptomyces anulatus]|nr:hypothetical protein [Streptomyces sp. or20]WSV72895.1 hypothetical protein OG333_00435 [Streptomyces anulatus]